MNQKFTKPILLIVAAIFVANQYYSCKKLDIVREVMITSVEPTGVGVSNATLRCELIDLGQGNISEFGCCYSTSGNPTVADIKAPASGTPELSVFGIPVAGLQPNTEYYFRAYAELGEGNPVAYGGAISFTTQDLAIETMDATNIAESSATLNGEIIDLGGVDVSSYGFVYSLENDPTFDDFKVDMGNNPSVGVYSASISGLNQNTTYYFRVYAEVNETGYISYGTSKNFTTLENLNLPVVTTDEIYSVTENSAVCAGNVSSEGAGTVTKKGFCISLQQNPTINDMTSDNGSGTGQFTHEFTGLDPSTTYYVRAYAQNSFGTAYGGQLSFYTSSGDWLQYDDGVNFDGIGLNEGGDFDVAIRFEPSQLQNYDGWKITKFRFFPRTSFPTTYSFEIYTGPEGTNFEYLQDIITVTPMEWNEIELEDEYFIDASQPLYPGYWIQSQPIGEYPAGCDEGPAITGNGDLISIDGVQSWVALSIASPDLNFNWNLQIYVANEDGEEQLLNPEPVSDPHKKTTDRTMTEVSSSKQSNR